MRRTLLSLILVAVAKTGAQAPVPPPPQQRPAVRAPLESNEMAMTVSGCVRGSRLRVPSQAVVELPFRALRVREFVLEGPRDVLQQIRKEHNGHLEEIAGIVVVPPEPRQNGSSVTTRGVAGGRVTVSAGRTETDPGEPQRPVTLRVESFTHVRGGCSDR